MRVFSISHLEKKTLKQNYLKIHPDFKNQVFDILICYCGVFYHD